MVRHRTHSIEFKRRVVQDYLAGETLLSLGRRYDLSRNLIRIWIQKFEAGTSDDEATAADTIQTYGQAALERLVGRQALEIEFLKGAQKHGQWPKSATTSVIAGPGASRSQKDAT
ncbi:MAG: transposase [Pseudomonadota bacterium]